jgi:hypothetical protein
MISRPRMAWSLSLLLLTGIERAAAASSIDDLLSGLRVRRSIEDKNEDDDPAKAEVTNPHKSSAAWSVDGALRYEIAPMFREGHHLEWAVGVEYHRITHIDEPQNTWAAALEATYLTGDPASAAHALSLAAGYKRDQIQKEDVLTAYLDYVPIHFWGIGMILPPGLAEETRRIGGFSWQPLLSVEYEQTLASNVAGESGPMLRARAGLELRIYPFAYFLSQRLQLYAAGDLRLVAASGTTVSAGTVQPLFRGGAILYFDEKNRVGVGLDYLAGQNPRDDLQKQQVLSFGVRVRI